MAERALAEVMALADGLTPQEQLRLAAHLLEHAVAEPCPVRSLKWRDICGIAAPSLLGEDAQEWVSRSRQEADAARERHLRH